MDNMKLLEIMNRDYSDSLIATPTSAMENNDIIKLKKRVRHLEYELSLIRDEAKSKEETLQKLLKEEVRKCSKFRTDLEIVERDQIAAANELKCLRQEQQIVDVSIKQVKESAHDLTKMAVTDREWLEEEMSRRSAVTKATKEKCESELARMRRRITLSW